MLSQANIRILALLGFSSAVHAAALLAYGYLNPPQPRAEAAAATIELTLQSAVAYATDVSTSMLAPVETMAMPPKVVATVSQQAVFRVTRPSEETVQSTDSTPSQVPVVAPVVEDLAITLESKIIAPSSDPPLRVPPESALLAAISLPPVERVAVIEEKIFDPALESHQPEVTLAASTPVAVDIGTRTSPESNPSESAESVRLANIKTQLGGQLLDAFESYFSYPLQARRKGWQGEVLLSVNIAGNGEIYAVQLLASSGYAVLDRAALKSMNQVEEVDLAQLDLSLPKQPLRIEVPIAYRLLN